MVNLEGYKDLLAAKGEGVTLVAVSKTKPVEAIEVLYAEGHRDFGENYVQELIEKKDRLPADIRWHFIGHLQSNKVKYIVPFVHLIHGVDSIKLLKEINKQGEKIGRKISVLLQVHIAREETKFGFDEGEVETVFGEQGELKDLQWVEVAGLMGMASFSSDGSLVRAEFQGLKSIFDKIQNARGGNFSILSMGMSGDYTMAVEEGSTMIRVGSLLFGSRS